MWSDRQNRATTLSDSEVKSLTRNFIRTWGRKAIDRVSCRATSLNDRVFSNQSRFDSKQNCWVIFWLSWDSEIKPLFSSSNVRLCQCQCHVGQHWGAAASLPERAESLARLPFIFYSSLQYSQEMEDGRVDRIRIRRYRDDQKSTNQIVLSQLKSLINYHKFLPTSKYVFDLARQ